MPATVCHAVFRPNTFRLGALMDLLKAIDNAARDLPAGYIINLGIENGAAWVELITPNYYEEYSIDGADLTLAEQIEYAVKTAIEVVKKE
jgi:hypothetical protein